MPRAAGLLLAAGVLAGCASKGPPPAPPPAVAVLPPLAKEVARSVRAYLPEEDGGRSEPRDAADFASAVYAEHGIDLPKTVAELSLAGVRAAPEEVRPGDLLFFSGERVSRIAEHVGVYLEKGLFAHYRPGYGVTLERFDSPYYKPRLITIRRLIL